MSRVILKLVLVIGVIYSAPVCAWQEEGLEKITPVQSLLPMLLGLAAILLLIFLLAGILKKFSGFNLTSSQIKIIDCQRIGTKEKLIVVKVQDRHLLLGVTPQNINHLTELEQPIENKAQNLSFDKLMNQFLGQSKKPVNVQSKEAS